MKTLRTENVTKTTVYRGTHSGRWFIKVNDVTLGSVGVARHQPDPISFRTRAIATDKAKQLRVVEVLQAGINAPVYAVQK